MIKFGTDGWRAVISEDFTFSNVRIVSQAIAEYFKDMPNAKNKIVVGYDTRFLSNKYAELVSEVMAANGINVILSDKYSPTPMVSYCIKLNELDGGVMVTASHNPFSFNGIKVKAHYAGSSTPEITQKIESYLNQNEPKIISFDEGKKKGLINVKDISKDYIDFVRSYLDLDLLKKSKFDIVVDVMHGTGNHLFDAIVDSENMRFKVINDRFNPSFEGINPEPIPENLKKLSKVLKNGSYDIGIAVDGDSDRVGAMTPDGDFITPGWILSMLLVHFVKNKKMSGKVIKTISNSTLIKEISEKYKLELEETPVGFKHICKIMQQEDVLIGGEESGGIGFKNYIPERDGILSGLLLLEMMAYEKKNILDIKKEMEDEFGQYEYSRIDMEYPEDKKSVLFDELDNKPFESLLNQKVVDVKDYDGKKFICEDNSWLLFRLSGTEPKLRIYSEGHTKERVNSLLEFGKKFALDI